MRQLGVVVALALLLLCSVIYILWAVWDARRRRKPVLLVLIAVVFFFPLGLVAWLVFRPRRVV
jgi:hypothetical protein